MKQATRLSIALFILRLTIFVVMAIWTADKFAHPGHARGTRACEHKRRKDEERIGSHNTPRITLCILDLLLVCRPINK